MEKALKIALSWLASELGKHFRVRATDKVYKSTGRQKEKGGNNYIQIVREYTVWGQEMPEFLAEDSLEETNDPIEPLPYDPERLKKVEVKKGEELKGKIFKVIRGDVQANGFYKGLPEGKYFEVVNDKNRRFYIMKKDLEKLHNVHKF